MSQTTPDSPMDNPHSPPTDSHGYATKPYETEGMPPGIPYIIGNEAAERFSFYGMKAILIVFMTKELLNSNGVADVMDKNTAYVWYHNFVAAAYLLPLAGAILSDWLFGKYRTIILLSLVYCFGHLVLAMMDTPLAKEVEPRTLLFWGLALIAVGSGGIKPCVSAHVGDQFSSKNQHLIAKVYNWFYFSINFGSFFSTLLTPILLEKAGPAWAFGIPGVLMAVATFLFWMGRNQYAHIPPAGNDFFRETFSSQGLRAIRNLAPLYLLIAMFWALYDQTGSSWVEQADHMNRDINLGFQFAPLTGDDTIWTALPSQIQAVNPILIMIMVPIFYYGIYPFLGRFFAVTPMRKIGVGFLLTAVSFAIIALAQAKIDAGQQPTIGWQILAFVVITTAEVLVSTVALEFSYTQAPTKMKSFILSLYLLSVFAGNMFASQVNSLILMLKGQGTQLLEGANYFWFFAICMFVFWLFFLFWSPFYKGAYYIQGEPEPIDDDLTQTPAQI